MQDLLSRLVGAFSFIGCLFAVTVLVAADTETFETASSVEEVRRQIEKLPKDTSWWNVNGTDMAWNNKNLNRIFPTVNVYRAGPVRELEHQPMPEISDYEVDTPSGPVRFTDFLNSDASTCMGMVILHRGKIVFEDYPRMQAYERPIFWSVTKVLVSAVVSILEQRGTGRDRQEYRHLYPGAVRFLVCGDHRQEYPRHGDRRRLSGGVLRHVILLLPSHGDDR